MTYTLLIAVVVFLALPAAARIATYYRWGGHGRPDLEAGHTRDLRPAEAFVRARHPSQQVQGDGRPDLEAGHTRDLRLASEGSRTRTKDRHCNSEARVHLGAMRPARGPAPRIGLQL